MKQRKITKKAMAVLMTVGVISTSFPALSATVHAAESPEITQFATVDELKSFNTNDNDGEVNPAKVYFGKNNQQWWIAGSQNSNLTLFAASPLATDMAFDSEMPINWSEKGYDGAWGCTYTGIEGMDSPWNVSRNHYGGSPLRNKVLKNLETSYFSTKEQNMMNETTIYTEDMHLTDNVIAPGANLIHNKYYTNDKLYLAHSGEKYEGPDAGKGFYITVGANSVEDLNSGLRIDADYYQCEGSGFWLRTPDTANGDWDAVLHVADMGMHGETIVWQNIAYYSSAVVPAFELDLSSVLFGSTVPAVSQEGQQSENDAFTLRYKSDDLGSALISYDRSKVTLINVPANTYLVVQNKDGAWSKQMKGETTFSANDINSSLTSFENCKVWLETSDELTYAAQATELKDGNTLIVKPTDLTGVYEENLSDVQLSGDWKWMDETTSLIVGKEKYPAYFDTSTYESEYDFSNVERYDFAEHRVVRDLEVTVAKADSKIEILTQDMNKVYDGNAVIAPEYKTSGSDGKVTIQWQENIGLPDTPIWKDLQSAPSSAGNYRVVVELAENNNYNATNATLEFAISKKQNIWLDQPTIDGWTYGDKANDPNAKAEYGDVTFTYSSKENGTYINEVPKNAGTYYMKATVKGNENYFDLESIVSFEIKKAIPTPEKVTGLVLGQGQPLIKIELPEQFKWVDETITADELGAHTFKAIYTPEDTVNYQMIEVEIEVEVVPTPVAINHIPTINASDETITVGEAFDPLKDVTAKDTEDGDLTTKIKVIHNTVDTKKADTYKVTYQVTDSQGATVTKTIKVIVKAAPVNPDTGKPDNDKNDESVKTGDRNNLLLLEVLMIGSNIVLLYSLYRKKTKNKSN